MGAAPPTLQRREVRLIYTIGRHVSAAGSKVTVWLQLEERQLSESKSLISEVQFSSVLPSRPSISLPYLLCQQGGP